MIMLTRSICRAQVASPTRYGLQKARSNSQIRHASNGAPSRSAETPFRMAIVGSGPAGFYTAFRVMKQLPNAKIDMYETLPVPFGLVRYGVAPDHPEVKNCQDKFEEVASSPNFTFIGNVSVGQPANHADQAHVQLESLARHYDSILLAYGASEDKKLGIFGESTMKGIYSAREFVGWYNGHPDCTNLLPELTRGEEAVIIGQGNVALDVARMLLEDVDVLRKTDITEHALAELSRSKVKRVRIVGRRGPMQAAFTIKELREMVKLKDVAMHDVDQSVIPQDTSKLPRPAKRMMDMLKKGSNLKPGDAPKSWSLDSCLSPQFFVAHPDDPTGVASTDFSRTKLSDPFDPTAKVVEDTGSVILPSDLVFRSIGYKSTPLDGFAEAGVQFDERRGVVNNDGWGRMTRFVSPEGPKDLATEQVPGWYCSGWLKTGPTGVIATTMMKAFESGDAIVNDWQTGRSFLRGDNKDNLGGWEAVRQDLPDGGKNTVQWDAWQKIDKAEKEVGKAKGKEREKFAKTADMLAVLG